MLVTTSFHMEDSHAIVHSWLNTDRRGVGEGGNTEGDGCGVSIDCANLYSFVGRRCDGDGTGNGQHSYAGNGYGPDDDSETGGGAFDDTGAGW